MAEVTAINVGIHLNGKVVDLRVPNRVNKEQLKHVIGEALSVLSVPLPSRWQLKLLKKSVGIGDGIALHQYTLSDGDQFAIEFDHKGDLGK